MPSSGSVLSSNPTKAFGFSVEGWYTLKKGICPLPFQKKQVWAMPFTVTQVSSVMMSSPSPTNGAQDLHEDLLSVGDAAFPRLSNQTELWHYFEVVKHTVCKKIMLLVHVKTTVGDAHIYWASSSEERKKFHDIFHATRSVVGHEKCLQIFWQMSLQNNLWMSVTTTTYWYMCIHL